MEEIAWDASFPFVLRNTCSKYWMAAAPPPNPGSSWCARTQYLMTVAGVMTKIIIHLRLHFSSGESRAPSHLRKS